MNEKSSELKKQISASWDLMKVRYPIVVHAGAVQHDEVKGEFLGYIDSIRSAEEIREYFGLGTSDAHLIFTDLLNLGAIRFLDDQERLPFLKQQQVELKKKVDFLRAEKNKLVGEDLYLNRQTKEIANLTQHYREEIPKLKGTVGEVSGKIGSLRADAEKLWDSNSELFGLAKEMKIKEKKIKEALERLEDEVPKLIKKKTRLVQRLAEFDEKVVTSKIAEAKTEKTLVYYRDVVEDVSEYLEDTKVRVDHLMRHK